MQQNPQANSHPTLPQFTFIPRNVSFGFVVVNEHTFPGDQNQQTPLSNLPQQLLGNIFSMTSGHLFGGQPNPPGFTGGSYQDLLDYLLHQHQPRGTPAKKDIVDQLPQVNIDSKQLDEGLSCAVCKDNFQLKEIALQLPCNHFYHNGCIIPWLSEHNTCPVCRYELPVDDQQYEEQRKKRMTQRNIPDPVVVVPQQPSPTLVPGNQDQILEEQRNREQGKMEETNQQAWNSLCEMENTMRQSCALLEPEDFVALQCGHSFHTECLESFLRIQEVLLPGQTVFDQHRPFSCPKCRETTQPVRDVDVD